MSYTNFTFVPAPLSVLILLGTAALVVALLTAAAILGLAGRPALAGKVGLSGVAVLVAYAGFLAGLGAVTPSRTVPHGGEKFFCGVDCHIGYSVTGISESTANASRRVVVTLRARFDETTISPHRGNGPLTPDPLAATLVDVRGRRFAADPAGISALRAPLRPSESYTTDLTFQVPPGAGGAAPFPRRVRMCRSAPRRTRNRPARGRDAPRPAVTAPLLSSPVLCAGRDLVLLVNLERCRAMRVVSHRLLPLARAHPQGGWGVYSSTAFRWRTLKKIIEIVREEMDRAGAQEMPSAVSPAARAVACAAGARRPTCGRGSCSRSRTARGRSSSLAPDGRGGGDRHRARR